MRKITKNGLLAVFLLVVAVHPFITNCVQDSQKNNRSWFSFATVTQVWNTIKNGLGLTTNFTGFLTGPKKPQATVNIDPRLLKVNYKYTASVAHMTQFLPRRALLLTPKPSCLLSWKNKWFWNDGKFIDNNKTTYQITHNGVNYCYAYNKEKKCWEPTGKNRMDYLTYYDYLLENKQNLEPFIEHLVTEMIDKSLVRSAPNKKDCIKAFTKAILNEEKYKEGYVFYSGCGWRADYWRDLVSALHSSLEGKKIDLERSKLEPCSQYNSAEEFLNKEYDYKTYFDCGEKGKVLISTNIAAFGNHDTYNSGSSSLGYFASNSSLCFRDNRITNAYTKLFEHLGLTSHKTELFKLLNAYSHAFKSGGLLKQFIVKPTQANQYGYLSMPCGHPCKLHQDNFTRCISEEIVKQGLAENTDSALTIEAVIGLVRTDPKNKCFKMNEMEAEELPINRLQARLIHTSPLFSDPNKSNCKKAKYIYASERDKNTHKKLREEMFKLVDQIIKDARKNGTLKI